MRLAAMVPARNEGPRLDRVLAALRLALPDAEVVVVDGQSEDDTAARARALGATVIPQQGRGYARALFSGYRYLQARGARRVVQLDADGQHPPEAAPGLLAALDTADLVIASRHGTGSPGSTGRRWGNAILAATASLACERRIHDATSGFWALGPRAIECFAARFPENTADANVRVMAVQCGLTLAEVPVYMAARDGGASMHDGWTGVRNFARSLGATVRVGWVHGDPT